MVGDLADDLVDPPTRDAFGESLGAVPAAQHAAGDADMWGGLAGGEDGEVQARSALLAVGDAGRRSGTTSGDAKRILVLARDNCELRRANEILKAV